MALKLMSSGGGSVTLDVPSTVSNVSMTVPVVNSGTLVTAGSTGNVPIGLSDATYRLEIASGDTTADRGYAARIRANATANAGSLQFTDSTGVTQYGYLAGTSTALDLQSDSRPMRFITTGSERMRIDSGGNLLVGTTSTAPNGGFAVSPTYGGAGVCQVNIGHSSSATSGQGFIQFFYNGGGIGGITQNGTTAVAYNTSSDYRLKENIQPMQNALDVVAQLNPVTYTWKADGSDGQGFIAHELQAVVPDCVTGEKDAVDKDGNPVYQGIDTSFLVATLTAAIQEQQELIKELKTRIEVLESK